MRDADNDFISLDEADAGKCGFLVARTVDDDIRELVAQVLHHVGDLLGRDVGDVVSIAARVELQQAQIRTRLRQSLTDVTSAAIGCVETLALRNGRAVECLKLTVVGCGDQTGHIAGIRKNNREVRRERRLTAARGTPNRKEMLVVIHSL